MSFKSLELLALSFEPYEKSSTLMVNSSRLNNNPMNFRFLQIIFTAFLYLNGTTLFGQDFFVISDKGNLLKVDLSTCSLTPRGTSASNIVYGDITYRPNGNFYAITKNSLYTIDTTSGSTNLVHTFSTLTNPLNAMTTDKNGLIYLTSLIGEFITYDLKTDKETYLGRIGKNGQFFIGSTGDLTFYKGDLYMVAGQDLIRVSLSNLKFCPVIQTFAAKDPVFGLAGFADCKGIKTFAVTSEKPNSRIFEIDWATNTYHQICSINTTVFGAASKYDLFASLASPDSVYLYQPTCTINKVGTVDRVVYTSSRGCDSVVKTEFTRQIDTVQRFLWQCTQVTAHNDTFYQVKAGQCDSLIILRTETAPRISDTKSVNVPVCEGNFFLAGGTRVTKSGSYPVTIKNQFGCDSTVTYNVSVNKKRIDSTVVNQVICHDNPYKFGEQDLSNEGTYYRTINNSLGCDSTIILKLSVWKQDSFFFYLTTCDSSKVKKVTKHELSSFNCDSIATVDTRFVPSPPNLKSELPPHYKIKLGDSVLLTPNLNFVPKRVSWRETENVGCNNCITTFAKPKFPNFILFTAYDSSDCYTQARTFIDVDRTRKIYIPNVFTPNDDKLNDNFGLFSDSTVVSILDFTIFNRTGVQFFSATNAKPDTNWDGTFNGKPAIPDVYMYYIKLRFKDGGEEEYYGDVTLVR